jgi:nickel/cobalt transporter (NicO) family protein
MNSRQVALALVALPALSAAHPLGNFTVNRYAALHVGARTATVRYVVDMAEIPAFQEIRRIDTDGDGTLAPAERDAYLAQVTAELAANLALTADGTRLALTPLAQTLEEPPGAGGLPTLRIDVTYDVPRSAVRGAVELRDRNYSGRPGWQEIVADAEQGIVLAGSTVPRTDRSQALRAYPADLLASPPQVREAAFRVEAGSSKVAPTLATEGTRVGAERFGDRLTGLVATREPLGAWMIVTSLLIAAGLGALHALSPGHGKTVVGAYLVGARGTARHALFLGLVVTATHTIGVYLLGLVTLTASHYVVPERIFPWLSILSGMLVVGIGTSLAASRLRIARGGHDHGHGHHHHHHEHGDHAHEHTHDHGHSHVPPPGPLGWRSLFALGVSGGLLPCPSALVVMLGAIALGRVAFGLCLIVAFSAGLAAVLTSVGLVLVYARGFFERLPLDGRFARYVPVASALVISVAGLALVAQALAQIGV